MYQKLSFLRNPRYPLPASVAGLSDTMNASSSKPQWVGTSIQDTTTRRMPATKAQLTTTPGVVFLVEPSELVFSEYQPGSIYMQVCCRAHTPPSHGGVPHLRDTCLSDIMLGGSQQQMFDKMKQLVAVRRQSICAKQRSSHMQALAWLVSSKHLCHSLLHGS